MQRGGFPAKTLILALFVVGTVYLLYLYNTALGRLRDAELSAERYRREEETKVAQLQEVMRSKDEMQERCENEKREFTNRLNSLNQQHKMLKSQYDEHEVEQMRLEQEARRVKEEFEQVEAQRNQEYQTLKQQKELELSTLRDQLADAQRQNSDLQNQIASLRDQIQNGQNQVDYDLAVLRNKESEIAALQQQLANKQTELEQQQQQHQQQQQQQQFGNQNMNFQQQQNPGQQNLHFDPNAQQQQQQQQQQQFIPHQQQQGAGVGQPVAAMNLGGNFGNNNNMVGQQQGAGQLNAGMAQGAVNDAQSQLDHQQRVEELNAQHQVLPPHGNSDDLVHRNPDSAGNVQVGGVHQQVNDEEHQVRPPNLHNDDNDNAANEVMDDRDEDDDINRHLNRQAGAPQDKDVDGGDEHEDPLEMKQVAPPNMKLEGDDQMGRDRPGELEMESFDF